MKRKKGQLLAEIREALAGRPDGLDSAALADHCRMTRPRMAVELWCLRRDGHLRASGGRDQRWFVSPTAPASAAPDQLVTLRAGRRTAAIPALEHVSVIGVPRTPEQVRAAAVEAGLVLAPSVKITVCPGGLDNRFSVDPRKFGGGDSIAEWKRHRTSSTEHA
jgi:hypothetical protein